MAIKGRPPRASVRAMPITTMRRRRATWAFRSIAMYVSQLVIVCVLGSSPLINVAIPLLETLHESIAQTIESHNYHIYACRGLFDSSCRKPVLPASRIAIFVMAVAGARSYRANSYRHGRQYGVGCDTTHCRHSIPCISGMPPNAVIPLLSGPNERRQLERRTGSHIALYSR